MLLWYMKRAALAALVAGAQRRQWDWAQGRLPQRQPPGANISPSATFLSGGAGARATTEASAAARAPTWARVPVRFFSTPMVQALITGRQVTVSAAFSGA
ncbi:hypothetical protein Shyhy02_25860 [Streptomyces hygroscopicus subsp. hygroscopicus]|nr:hypothetical protein Shyhy02_25860 [Streptomyces hygroscopicus subsp. hygroscopicus]